MASVGCDRKILKAFYTQYVAVLLILLTFCVGAYQRSPEKAVAAAPALPARVPDVRLAGFTIDDPYAGQEQIPDGEPHLSAVVALIKNHDVNATLELSLPRPAFQQDKDGVRGALRRAAAIESFLLSRGVERHTFTLVIRDTGGDGKSVSVTFVRPGEVEHDQPS